jgi:hypothetical protein
MTTEETKKNEYIIDPKSVQDSFEKELKQYDSSARIFFSGKYGVGKTKFLERFFEEKKEEYLKIHLYPVNYQISTNEDIIDLLKYDILVELFEKYEEYFKTNQNIPWYVLVKSYISQKNTNEILSGTLDILEVIPAMGQLGRPLKTFLNIDKEFQEFKSIYQTGEKGLAEEYLSRIKEDDLTETDIISQLIKNKIQEIKGKKESVLIIDDLDRLDPEHIFRILNVLSAHFDQDGDNKFGFDYIIIVGDYKNIQSIFHHKYGKDADFDGYIDKFYTVKPFEFDNRKALLANLGAILEEYQRDDYGKNPNQWTFRIVDDILRKSIASNNLNLRALLKNQQYKLLSLHEKQERIPREGVRVMINRAIDILIDVFGTKEKLIGIIQQIKSSQLKTGLIGDGNDRPYRRIIEDIYNPINSPFPQKDNTFHSQHSGKEYKFSLIRNSVGVPDIDISSSEDDILYQRLYYDILSEYIEQDKHLENSTNVWE